MVDGASSGEQHADFGRESLQLNKDLEKMTEQMENVSVHLTWMAYDMVVLRTNPQLAKSFRRLEDEYLKCKLFEMEAHIFGPAGYEFCMV
uniref:Zgc:194246 n=1 Tax=Astyanax mexicanus TaxID=7994 RepID=A0A3B1JB22_ASTMX